MKARALATRASGAFVGLAAGDALGGPAARLSPHEAEARAGRPRALLHGAATTWSLAVLDGLLYRRDDEALGADLALRLCTLAAPLRGLALRGLPGSLAGTLAQVARALEKDPDPRLCGVDDVLADGLCTPLALAFALGDDDADVAAALVEVVALTHRHVRVSGAAGLWLGGLRALLRGAAGEAVLDEGEGFARLTLSAYREQRAGVLVGEPSEAEGALALALAAARGAALPSELLPPPGLDGRDAPERLAAAALLAAALAPGELVQQVQARVDAGGDADASAPLLAATFGLARGADHLPLALAERVATGQMVRGRAAALLGERPPRLPPLIDEELRLSRRAEGRGPPAAPREEPGEREQLKLL